MTSDDLRDLDDAAHGEHERELVLFSCSLRQFPDSDYTYEEEGPDLMTATLCSRR